MSHSSTRSAAAAALALLCLVAPARAQISFSDLDKAMARQTAGKDANYILPNQTEARANIDTRLAQLRAQVSIALSRHWLLPEDASTLNKQLDMLQALETRNSRVGLSAGEARDLVGRINTVAININRAMSAAPPQGHVEDRASNVSNLENQRLYLQSRIDQGVRLGRLSSRDVSGLRRQLDAITRYEQRPGGLTSEDQLRLRRQMAELNSSINRLM